MLAVALTLALLSQKGRPVQSAATAPGPPVVDLSARISRYVAPFRAGQGYRAPTAVERSAVADAVAELVAGRGSAGRARLGSVGYRVNELRDRATGRLVDEVADADPARESGRGWGRIYLDLSAAARWTVQVPHPVADQNTEKVGAAVFEAEPGGVLVVAGAHRRAAPDGAADVAHNADTVFAAVLDRLARAGLPGIQVHGFDEGSLPGVDSVFSPGAAAPGPAVLRTAEALTAAGFSLCRPWLEGCGQLAGTTNVEGRYAASIGVPFLHVELSPSVRAEAGPRQRLAVVLGRTAARWNAGEWGARRSVAGLTDSLSDPPSDPAGSAGALA